MAVGTAVTVEMRGLGKFRNLIARVAKGMGARAELHQRYGIQAMNWVQRNFASEGALTGAPWAKLSPNTIVGRRKGGVGAKILRDTGQMSQSFVMDFSSEQARVGTAKEYALYHEKGTEPYEIRPKKAKLLAFPSAGGNPLGKAMKISERKYSAETPFAFAKVVHHPGLVPRPMLPTAANFRPILERVTINFLKELQARGETIGPED